MYVHILYIIQADNTICNTYHLVLALQGKVERIIQTRTKVPTYEIKYMEFWMLLDELVRWFTLLHL